MADYRKGELLVLTCAQSPHLLMRAFGTDDEATIKVASKKNPQAAKLKKGKLLLKTKPANVREAGDYEQGISTEGTYAKHIFLPVFRPI